MAACEQKPTTKTNGPQIGISKLQQPSSKIKIGYQELVLRGGMLFSCIFNARLWAHLLSRHYRALTVSPVLLVVFLHRHLSLLFHLTSRFWISDLTEIHHPNFAPVPACFETQRKQTDLIFKGATQGRENTVSFAGPTKGNNDIIQMTFQRKLKPDASLFENQGHILRSPKPTFRWFRPKHSDY